MSCANLLGQQPYVPGKLYIKFQPGETIDALDDLVTRYEVSRIAPAFITQHPLLDGIYELTFEEIALTGELVEKLVHLPEVVYVEQIPFVYSHFVPDDYDSTALYHLNIVRAPEAWDLSQGADHVVIAIVDNGVLTTHEDLADNIWENPGEIPNDGIDNDRNGFVDDWQGWDIGDNDNDPNPIHRTFRHGSHVAGCASATTHNAKGIASLGFTCQLMPVKAASDIGGSDSYPFSTALRAVDYAIINRADIINMSFGGTEYLATGEALMQVAHEMDILLVAAAGNGPGDTNPATNDTTYEYPASFAHVISVAGTDANDLKASICTHNRHVDVCAPALSIRSTVPSVTLKSSYSLLSGSSQATPIVSGLLGLMLAANPCLTSSEAETLLKAGCVNIDALNPAAAGGLGAGRIDAAATLALLQQTAAPHANFLMADTVACDSVGLPAIYLRDSLTACPDTWSWTTSHGQQSNLPDPVFYFGASGSYTISLVVENAFGRDSSSQQVQVNLAPSPTVNAGLDQTINVGDSATLGGSGNALNYTWSPGNDLFPNPFILNPKTSPDSTTWYVLTGKSVEGCTHSDSVLVKVLNTISIEHALASSLVAVAPIRYDQQRQVWHLHATVHKVGEMDISLYSVEGKRIQSIFSGEIFPGQFNVSSDAPATLPFGIYIVVWEMGRERWAQKMAIYR